jgi:hypothetical protein
MKISFFEIFLFNEGFFYKIGETLDQLKSGW